MKQDKDNGKIDRATKAGHCKDETEGGGESLGGRAAAPLSAPLPGLRRHRDAGGRENLPGMPGQAAAPDAALVHEMREKAGGRRRVLR